MKRKLGESDIPPFGFVWNNAPAGDYSLTARVIFGGEQSTNSNTVAVHLAPVPPPVLSLADRGSRSYEIRGNGIPGLAYHLQFVEELSDPNWQNLSTVTANPSGIFALTNFASSERRFYRSVYP